VSQDGGRTWQAATPPQVGSPSWSPSPGFTDDGVYQIMVQAEDSDGVRSEPALSGCYVLDRVPPQVELTVPSVGLETNDRDIVFTATASDPPWFVAEVLWEVRKGGPLGPLVQGASSFTEPNASFTPQSPLTDEGLYFVRVVAVDKAGNATDQERSFRLDTTRPQMLDYELLVTRSRVLNGDLYTADVRPGIRVLAVDNPGGSGFNVSGQLDIEVFHDAAMTRPVSGSVSRTPGRPLTNDGTWTAAWTPSEDLTSGAYYPSVTIVDDAGNRLVAKGEAYKFVVDGLPPEISADSSVGQANTNNGRHFANSRRPVITWPADSSTSRCFMTPR